VKDAICEATIWRDQKRERIGWDGTDMSDYTFASREGAEEAKAAVHTRLDLLPPQDEEGWPDRKHLPVKSRETHMIQSPVGSTFCVHKFVKSFPVLSADRCLYDGC